MYVREDNRICSICYYSLFCTHNYILYLLPLNTLPSIQIGGQSLAFNLVKHDQVLLGFHPQTAHRTALSHCKYIYDVTTPTH